MAGLKINTTLRDHLRPSPSPRCSSHFAGVRKRFYRKKYDAAKVLAEFAATCRDETDLDKLTARLVQVVEETMQPESVGVWLKKTGDHKRPATNDGGP
jgi:hypothetical protein